MEQNLRNKNSNLINISSLHFGLTQKVVGGHQLWDRLLRLLRRPGREIALIQTRPDLPRTRSVSLRSDQDKTFKYKLLLPLNTDVINFYGQQSCFPKRSLEKKFRKSGILGVLKSNGGWGCLRPYFKSFMACYDGMQSLFLLEQNTTDVTSTNRR